MKYALKEWGTTIEALSKGMVTAIWKKGGVEDNPNIKTPFESFNIEQKQFVLFPTFTHQKPEKVRKDLWSLLDQNTKPNKDNQIKIKYWAEVEEEITVETQEQLLSISSELVNSNEHLISSWNLYPSHKGKLLLLRVYTLSNPVLIPNSPEYAGCKSWIELKVDIPRSGSKPVLPFKEFNRKGRLIKAFLENALQTTAHDSLLVRS
ncbi:MAG: DUF1802 family protein [Candidatus Melainabacteria bacterium]|nr:DUF1802 family protein [Candidatus Melainabacteria bacterium]